MSTEFHNPFDTDKVQPKKKKRSPMLVVFVLLGLCSVAAIGVCGFVAFRFVSRVQNGPGFNDFSKRDTSGMPDNAGERFAKTEQVKRVMTGVLEGNRYQDLDERQITVVDQFLKRLNTALESGKDAPFAKLMNQSAFERRAFASSQMTDYARRSRGLFDDWIEFFNPGATKARLASASLAGNELFVITYLEIDYETNEFAWYLNPNGQLVDWMEVEEARPHSEFIAREFSAAVLNSRAYDHYYNLQMNYSADTTEEAEKHLQRCLSQSFPEALRNDVYLDLASISNTWELPKYTRMFLAKMAPGYKSPELHQIRIRYNLLVEKPEDALRESVQLGDMLGPNRTALALRVEVLQALQRNEEAALATLDLIRVDPQSADYAATQLLANHLSSGDGEKVLAVVKSGGLDTAQICSLADSLFDSYRTDLAEPILEYAREQGESPELTALEANLSSYDGDLKAAVSKYRKAIAQAPKDHPKRSTWLVEWGNAMSSLKRSEEAVRTSPDPIATFYYFTLSEGFLEVPVEEAARYVQALKDAKVSEEDQRRRDFWVAVGSLLVQLEGDDPNPWPAAVKVYQGYESLSKEEQADELTEFVDEMQSDWLATAAVQSDKLPEAFALLSPEIRTPELAGAVLAGSDERIKPMLEQLRRLHQESKGDASMELFLDGELKLLAADKPGARKDLLKFFRSDPAHFVKYRVQSWLAEDAVENGAWEQLATEFQDNWSLLNSILGQLNEKGDTDASRKLFDMTRENEQFANSWIHDQVRRLQDDRKWEEVVQLVNDLQLTEDQGVTQVAHATALLNLKRFDEVKPVLDQLPQASQTWLRGRLLAHEGDVDALIAFVRSSDRPGPVVDSVYSDSALREAVQSDQFAPFRELYPQSFPDSTYDSRVVLLSEPHGLNTAEVKSVFKDVLPGLSVVEITNLIARNDEQAKAWRVDHEDVSFLLTAADHHYDRTHDGKMSRKDVGKQFQALVESHKSWIAVDIDWDGPTTDVKEIGNRLVAVIFKDRECVAFGGSGAFIPFSEENVKRFHDHDTDTIETFSVYHYPDEIDWRMQENRRRKLKQYVVTESPATVQLAIDYQPGPFHWAPVWLTAAGEEGKNRRDRFITEVPDSPLHPKAYRGRRVYVNNYEVTDWKKP